MTGLIVAVCVLILLMVLLLRIGVQVEYSRDLFAVRLRIGVKYVQIVPGKPKKKQTKTAKTKDGGAQQTGNQLDLLRALLPLILRTIRRVCGKLRVDKLDLVLTAGAEDPGDAAMQYGWANAVLGSLWSPIVSTCRVEDGHAKVEIDFNAKQPTVYLLAELSLRVGQILALSLAFAVQALFVLIRKTKHTTPN